MLFKIYNSLNHKEYSFEVTDKLESNLFYVFDLTLPEGILDGEYEFTLYDRGREVSSGLLQIGDYVPEKKSYKKDNNEIKVYKG